MPKKSTPATVLVVLTLLLGLGACGSSKSDPRAPLPQGYSSWVVGDVSGSTRKARPLYVNAFERFATTAGQDGSGALYLILAAGDPQAEGAPKSTSVAPTHADNEVYAPGEIATAVQTAAGQFAQMLRDPPVSRGGSALLEAVAVSAHSLHRGDRLLIASDGIQSSDLTGDFHDVDLTAVGFERLLTKLRDSKLLPDLSGVRVEMPLLLAHPGGTTLTQKREGQIRAFWQMWARRTGAELDMTPEA